MKVASLATMIGCQVGDIITLIARRIDDRAIDISVETVAPRLGDSRRVRVSIDPAKIDALQNLKDPLRIRAAGLLLRMPVMAAFDCAAATVLDEMHHQYGVEQ